MLEELSQGAARQAIVATSTTEAEVSIRGGQRKASATHEQLSVSPPVRVHQPDTIKNTTTQTSQHPTVNDETQYKLLGGSIIPKKDVKEFSQNGVLFDGDEEMTPIDLLSLPPASVSSFPFLTDDILRVRKQ
ncbi:dimethylaniline monooxygenase [Trichonephila clavipes]|nr:dimethylaniline monooxygenase [Trichonephila clavipes]